MIKGFRKRTAKLFKDCHDAIAALQAGQECGVVRNDVEPHGTATFLIAAYEGHVSLATNPQDAQVLQAGQKRLIHHLESLRAAHGRMLPVGGS